MNFFSHDVAEVANVLAYSFGEEDVDRHIVLFKREHAPSEDQLNTLRKGEEWNEKVAEKLKEERERRAREEAEYQKSRKRKEDFVPNSFYKDKYQHLIGKEAALEAARKTEANSNYGFGKYFEKHYTRLETKQNLSLCVHMYCIGMLLSFCSSQ